MPLSRRTLLASAVPALVRAAHPPVRTGILGIQHGHLIGKLQAMYANPAYEVISICEPDPATRSATGGHPLFARLKWVSMDEMLADPSLNLIVFEGEVKDAVPFGKRVLTAGKHLHLEKPPSNKLQPMKELVDLARARGLKLQLGYIWRFHAGVDLALEAHRNGWLGDVFMIRATINSDRGQSQRDVEARYPGGSMFELGGHMIDRVIAFLGRPTSVRHWLRHHSSVNDKLNDNTLAVLEYPKALAIVVSSAKDAASSQHRSLEILGTEGSILIQPMEPSPTVRIYVKSDRGPYRKGWQEQKLQPQPRYGADMADLARAIQTGTPLKYSYDHELLLQETLLRASGEIE